MSCLAPGLSMRQCSVLSDESKSQQLSVWTRRLKKAIRYSTRFEESLHFVVNLGMQNSFPVTDISDIVSIDELWSTYCMSCNSEGLIGGGNGGNGGGVGGSFWL